MKNVDANVKSNVVSSNNVQKRKVQNDSIKTSSSHRTVVKSNSTQASSARKRNVQSLGSQSNSGKNVNVSIKNGGKSVKAKKTINKREVFATFMTILCVCLGMLIAIGSFRYLYMLALPERVHEIVTFYAMWLAIGLTALLAGFNTRKRIYSSADAVFTLLCIVFFILCFKIGKVAISEVSGINCIVAVLLEIFGIFLIYLPLILRVIKAGKRTF